MTHFHLMRSQKHNISSIVVLNMAKYTIISLILTDFVPIFFIFNLFRNILGGHSDFEKSQVDFRGWGVNPFQKSPDPARRGSSPLWTVSQVPPLFSLESFPNRLEIYFYPKPNSQLIEHCVRYLPIEYVSKFNSICNFCLVKFFF